MKVVIVDANISSEKLAEINKQYNDMGYRWASTSTTGLPENQRRLTYLPEAAFRKVEEAINEFNETETEDSKDQKEA